MAQSLIHSKPMNWACRSLIGNIVLSELTFGIVIFVAFCGKTYSDGDLTGSDVVFFAMLCGSGGFVMGLLFWFGLARPLLAKSDGTPYQRKDS